MPKAAPGFPSHHPLPGLMKGKHLLPVRVHRRWREEGLRSYPQHCETEIQMPCVVITPGIHPDEKTNLDYARKTGGRMIILSICPKRADWIVGSYIGQ